MPEDKPQTVTQFYLQHREHGGHDNDSILIDKIAEAFPIDKPPEVVAVPYVPSDFVPASPEVAEYHRRRTSDPNFDLVRERMLERLQGEERELADREHSEFLFYYRMCSEELRQEAEARAAEEKEVRDRAEAAKDRLRKIMGGRDKTRAADAEAKYLERFVKW